MVADVFSMLLELLDKKCVTARSLAEKMEVSVRTVYRYVDVLSSAHVPVYCQKGRGGGIMIGSDFRLSSCYFTEDELQLLKTAVDALRPSTRKTSDISRKLGALRGAKAGGSFVSENFTVDTANMPNSEIFAAKFDALLGAKKEGVAVRINYHNRKGEISERVIEPYTFVYNDSNWYVYANCRRDGALRLFKISRITHIFPTGDKYTVPAYEKEWNLEDPTRTKKIQITLAADETARYDVEEWLGIENVSKSQDGTRYIAHGEVYDNAATLARLVGFGAAVRVSYPARLAAKVADEHRRALGLPDKDF